MDAYENEYISEPAKESPFADSPFECAYVETDTPEFPVVDEPETKKNKGNRRGLKAIIAIVVLLSCCAGTAIGVSSIWKEELSRMETAMNDKFAALEQLYSEKQQQTTQTPNTQTPNTQTPNPDGSAMTPGQVYAQNAEAVVAVSAVYKSASGTGESRGSGFVISADGYAVTNYHVVENATSVSVTTHAGKSIDATVKGDRKSVV